MLHFTDGLVLHAHMGMSGGWHVYLPGQRWRKPRRSAWLVMDLGGVEVAEFGGPTLRLVRPAELRRDSRLALLGPDILGGPEAVAAAAANVAAARTDGARRGPAQPAPGRRHRQHLQDRGLLRGRRSIRGARSNPSTAAEIERGGRNRRRTDGARCRDRPAARPHLPQKPGSAARAAGGRVRSRGQGDDNRTTYWCPGCQK